MNRHMQNETTNFLVEYVTQRCLANHHRRIDILVRSLRQLLDNQNRDRVSQVDFLLRFNLIMFQYMTYERP